MAAIRRKSVLIGCVPPTRSISLFLDRAQQLGLQLVAQVADLVEEQRAAGRQLELAELLADRAGERALLVAEQRALDQLLGNRGEVDGDERRVRLRPTRDECRRASSSLPVPLSPRISTVADSLRDLLHQLDDRRASPGWGRRRTRGRSVSATSARSRRTWRFRSWRSLALATQRAQRLEVEVLGDVVVGAVAASPRWRRRAP